jgi:protein-histidine N-methyltransferase
LNKNGEPQLALIPVMDFLNHQYGQECVHYDLSLQRIECKAMTDIVKNDQIFMFYGKRTNAEYFIHNGFVPNQSNPDDSYLLKLGKRHTGLSTHRDSLCCLVVALPKTDKAFEEKHQLLQRYGLEA